MAFQSGQGSRLGQALVLAGGLLVGALLVGGSDSLRAREPTTRPPTTTPVTSDDGDTIRLINEKIAEQWQANKLTPSARVNDYEFIRRVSLDLLGRIARPDEIGRFLKDPPDSRRRLLIDRLLSHEDFAKNWANLWTVWLMTRSGALDENTRVYHEQMHDWLLEQFSRPTLSWKDLVTELVTATGKTNENGAVNFVLSHLGESVAGYRQGDYKEGQFEMVPITSRTTRLFLGLQTQCTQCHDHPFNPEWRQQHFWGVNAFYRQVERKGVTAMRRNQMASVLELKDNSTFNTDEIVFYEKRNGVVLTTRPVFLDGARPEKTGGTRRQELALFLTRSEYFPKEFVNRMWGHFMGRGFTNPVDDFGEHNPVSHPELLDELSKKFVQYGYDLRRLLRWICNSEPYNLSSVANATNESTDADPFFSRMLLKAMTPEALFESLMVATQAEVAETKDRRRALRERWMRSLIVNFGDDEGNEANFNGTVVQALLMMNGTDINNVISQQKKGTVALALMRRGASSACLTDLYLAALNRPPTPKEVSNIMRIIRTAPIKTRGDAFAPWQDVFWALINSNEFILNH